MDFFCYFPVLKLFLLILLLLAAIISLFFFLFFYILFESLNCCIHAIFNACKFSSSSFSFGYKTLCIFFNFLVLWSICLSSSLIHFKKALGYFTKNFPDIYSFDKISAADFGFEKFSYFSEVFLTFSFISVCLIVSASNIPWYL